MPKSLQALEPRVRRHVNFNDRAVKECIDEGGPSTNSIHVHLFMPIHLTN
jgi:hypothetical protein